MKWLEKLEKWMQDNEEYIIRKTFHATFLVLIILICIVGLLGNERLIQIRDMVLSQL